MPEPQASGPTLTSPAVGDSEEIAEEIAEELHNWGVPSELLQVHREQEEVAWPKPPPDSAGSEPLPSLVRMACLRFMSNVVQHVNLTQRDWFDATTLFDAFCARVEGGADVRRLPSTCIAIVRIVNKVDDVRGCFTACMGVRIGRGLSQWLAQLGHTATLPTTEASVNEDERHVLAVLGYQVNLPSLQTWLSQLCLRVDILTAHQLTPSLTWVLRQSMSNAYAALVWKSTSEMVYEISLTPRLLAIGLVSLGLIAAGLLPLEVLRPERSKAAEWEKLFHESQLQDRVPVCHVPPDKTQRMLDLLQEATMADMAELKKTAQAVAEALGAALRSVRSMALAEQAGQLSAAAASRHASTII